MHKVLDDGTYLYGIEVELPSLLSDRNSQTQFFWATCGLERSAAYEAAALQALVALQDLYGFVVLDYSIHGLVLYRTLAQRLLPDANRGVQLARIVIDSCHQGFQYDADVLAYAEQIIHEVNNIPNVSFSF